MKDQMNMPENFSAETTGTINPETATAVKVPKRSEIESQFK